MTKLTAESKNFIKLTPEDSLNLEFEHSLTMLKSIIGEEKFLQACKFEVDSPAKSFSDTSWSNAIKIVGINPRMAKTYWGIVKYAMTFPENAIHIMPLWETGDGSIYSQNSWELNKDFVDTNLVKMGFETAEKQLKFTINILHALGKYVGFDALEHVDNFSEIVILNPSCFEWVKLNNDRSAQDFSKTTEKNARDIENLIQKELNLPENVFELDEEERKELIFPTSMTRAEKFEKRMQIRKLIRSNLYEPIPVVEHSPMRPIVYERTEYSDNENWAVFTAKDKASAAVVIGSITPYKFYKIKDGYPVKNCFDEKVVDYATKKLSDFQKEYGFDFLRADMGHNQTAHSHNESKDMVCKEFWAILKDKIHENTPYFATFAEAFWGNYYISSIQDMINKKFDIVLGELNFKFLNEEYISLVKRYIEKYRKEYSLSPSLTAYTNDGDLPSHNELFASLEANECRYFISLFLDLPSYMGMGFETREFNPDKHSQFSNYYVKPLPEPFEFGRNKEQFESISKIRKLYSTYKHIIENASVSVLQTDSEKQLCWSYDINEKEQLLFCVNLDADTTEIKTDLGKIQSLERIYTNSQYDEITEDYEKEFTIRNIYIGEITMYKILRM